MEPRIFVKQNPRKNLTLRNRVYLKAAAREGRPYSSATPTTTTFLRFFLGFCFTNMRGFHNFFGHYWQPHWIKVDILRQVFISWVRISVLMYYIWGTRIAIFLLWGCCCKLFYWKKVDKFRHFQNVFYWKKVDVLCHGM